MAYSLFDFAPIATFATGQLLNCERDTFGIIEVSARHKNLRMRIDFKKAIGQDLFS